MGSHSRVPGEEDVLDYFKTCNNWGRWGPDDELGTLNYITPETRRAAFESVREGISVSCARLIPTLQPEADFQWPPMHFMTSSGEGWANKPTPLDALQVTSDFIGMVFHGFAITHVDSLCHIARDGQLYNGRPCELVSTASGATVLGVDTIRDGIVGRGVLLDIPLLTGKRWLDDEDAVYPDDLSSAEQLAGVEVRAGDIVLCRFGTMARRAALGPSSEVFTRRPGLHASCLPWLHERKIAALGSDGAQDLFPSGYPSLRAPLHQVGIVSMGLTLIDNCDLEALASTCGNLERWEFMITVAPLRIENGTGSPVNPIAMF